MSTLRRLPCEIAAIVALAAGPALREPRAGEAGADRRHGPGKTVGSGASFPPYLDAATIGVAPWGTLTFSLTDCNHGHVDWSSTAPGYGSGGMDLTRLTLPAGVVCPD